MKDILAKVYDYILMLRLQKWLQIPEQQTAYQKGKGCINHVFFVRCLIAIAKKKGQSLFIGVTNFTSANVIMEWALEAINDYEFWVHFQWVRWSPQPRMLQGSWEFVESLWYYGRWEPE